MRTPVSRSSSAQLARRRRGCVCKPGGVWGEHRTRSGSQALPFTFRQRLSLRAPWCGRDRA